MHSFMIAAPLNENKKDGEYHYEAIPMRQAFALHEALILDRCIPWMFHTIHPSEKYAEPNNYISGSDEEKRQGITGFHFEVDNMPDAKTASKVVLDIVEKAIGKEHRLTVSFFDALHRTNIMQKGELTDYYNNVVAKGEHKDGYSSRLQILKP